HIRRNMASIEPVDLDIFPQRLHFRLVNLYLARRTTGIVATLNDQDRRLYLLSVGNGRGAAVEFWLLRGRSFEERDIVGFERLGLVFPIEYAICHGNACHPPRPQIRISSQRQQRQVAPIGHALQEDLARVSNPLIYQKVSGRYQVLDFPVAHISPDLLLKCSAKGDRTAIIDAEEGEAMIKHRLRPIPVATGCHRVRSSMQVQDGRPWPVSFWYAQPRLNELPIRGRESNRVERIREGRLRRGQQDANLAPG